MTHLTQIGLRRVMLAVAGSVFIAMMLFAIFDQLREKEIALMLGEPWEDMRTRSSAKIAPVIPGHAWFWSPKSDARLRFIDAQYGFVTPVARSFRVSFGRDKSVTHFNIMPQIEPLPLNDALELALNLQDQWRSGGWKPFRVGSFPVFVDTPEWRTQLRDRGGKTYWQAGEKYRAKLSLHQTLDKKRPAEERYRVDIELSKWRGEY